MEVLEFIPFSSVYAQDFARLNYEWLETYFEIEEHDREMLDDPENYIIKQGGYIFLAKMGDEIVGTTALIHVDNETYELAKMAVSPKYQGKKIGQKLMDHVIESARKLGIKTLILESNTKLTPALNLYFKTGFREIPQQASPYARCNIRMQLIL